MTTVIDSVMTESTGNVECDSGDGKIKKSTENGERLKGKVKSNTVNESQELKNDSVEEFSDMPSLPSRKGVKRYIYQGMMDTLDDPSPAIN